MLINRTAFRFVLIAAISLVAGACSERITLTPPDQPIQNATVFVGDQDRKFYALNALTGSPQWQATTPEIITSSPAVNQGMVYALSDHQLYAFDRQTGQKKWTFTTEDTGANAPSTLISRGGQVYFVGNFGRKLYALDALTGAKKWAVAAPGVDINGNPIGYGVPTATDQKVYIGSGDKVYVLDAQTGGTQQTLTFGGGIYGAPLVAEGTLFVGGYDGKLYARDALSGQPKWESTLGGWLVYVNLVGRTLYVNSWQEVFALDVSTGAQQWRFKPAISGNTGARTLTNGIVYGAYSLLDSPEAQLYALDATTGQKKGDSWAWPGGFNSRATRAIAVDGLVYAAGRDHTFYALDGTSGQIKWSFPTSGDITTSPCVVTQQGVFF
ncbi:outer membrane protein assembly factor BamB family protein [Spirosoma endophyticum]|uniref:Outer membrane protein assembly factor BamB, contains PQQ-like beta-propeller repeat n=1 Tax=Spirosoma endophyticum TaxID=662367 RepID=A0A1I2HP93_9BACT|nr:PQQ-binding-like beta-propeller repeat protein [Spirosoma endophyticum]SFF30546.1 Outer membrane protein assembly factor BamB, contains PQQ-like beta-propeller repeat [Spirosoma endophyticum]